MTGQAKRAQVIQIALTSTFCDRSDVISVPQRATTGDGFHSIKGKPGRAGRAT